MLFKALVAIDVVVALVFLYFFFVGVGDGSVSSFNLTLWIAILAALALVLVGGVKLNAAGKRPLALVLLALVAVPGLLFALFFGVLIVTQPRWN